MLIMILSCFSIEGLTAAQDSLALRQDWERANNYAKMILLPLQGLQVFYCLYWPCQLLKIPWHHNLRPRLILYRNNPTNALHGS
jgi:hypothetical protein